MKFLKKIKEKFAKSSININELFKSFIIIIVLFSFSFASLATAYSSHFSFYNKKRIDWIDSVIFQIYQIKLFDIFLIYSGFNTGYGFFSPNVKSDILIINTFYKNGKTEIKKSDAFLKNREAKIRFRGVNDIFMNKLTIEEEKLKKGDTLQIYNSYKQQLDSLKMEYFKVTLKQMNRHYLRNDTFDSINIKVYLYHFPFLKEYPFLEPTFYEIETVSISK